MPTLKTIVTEYINLLDKPFDIALYRRVRQLVLNQRAFELSKSADRYGVNNNTIQYINPEFHSVNVDGDMILNPDDIVIRSINMIIRQAIDLTKECPLFYVGSDDLSMPFMYVNNYHTISRIRKQKHFARTPLYYIMQYHVYCVVPKGVSNVKIGHAWFDPGAIDLENNFIEDEYFDDNYEFLISTDMLQVIKEKLLKGELQVITPNDNEVKLNNNEKEGQQASQ